LTGRAGPSGRAVVTGGSRGIGHAVALALAERGWRLALIARDPHTLERALAQLPGDGHEAFPLDVASEEGWRGLSARLEDVAALVCAAAVLEPVGPIGTYAPDAFRRTLDVNVLGTVLAIEACLPGLRAARGAVVTFGGGGATAPLPRFDAYAASKAAVVRLSENLAVELDRMGVRINCIAPGFVATDIHRATLEAGPGRVGEEYFEHTRAELEQGGVPASEAAELACLLVEQDEDLPFAGRLISAQWDPWRDPEFRRRLGREPDLATLRRIDDVFFSSSREAGL
jgi:NAD(P)-dependent dehydrogenase (short-subunit alcohol dehydrogenase family)